MQILRGSQKKGLQDQFCSEAHKVMINLPSPLMTEANYKCKQLPIHVTHPMWLWYTRYHIYIWYTIYIWGWITVLAHKVVLAVPSSQRRTLTHSFFQRIGWSGHQKSESAVQFSSVHLWRIGAHSVLLKRIIFVSLK